MSEERKTHKRGGIVRYIVFAVCILLIAAVAVITVCAANNWFKSGVAIDAGIVKPDPKPEEPDGSPEADGRAISPIATLDIVKPFEFGEDVTLKYYCFHKGIDIAAPVGTDVLACLDGVVEKVVLNDQLDGNSVYITHADGVKTVYTFLDVKEGLKEGDEVKKGDVIGKVCKPDGKECEQTAHLHFEVYTGGNLTDPTQFLDVADK